MELNVQCFSSTARNARANLVPSLGLVSRLGNFSANNVHRPRQSAHVIFSSGIFTKSSGQNLDDIIFLQRECVIFSRRYS